MKQPSLQLAHAKALAALDDMSPFQRITAIHALVRETRDFDRLLRERGRGAVKVLRDTGATWAEIEERTGIEATRLVEVLRSKVGS